MVFQHFSLFEALTVAENISLALPAQLRQGDLSQRIADLSQDYGLPLRCIGCRLICWRKAAHRDCSLPVATA